MKIVIPTQLSRDEYFATTAGICAASITHSNFIPISDIIVVEKNTTGLSKLYNTFLDSNEIVVFMHDDVEIHDRFFYQKLMKAHETYDIVGLAGAANQTYKKGSPSLWHTSMYDPRIDGRGFVSHLIPQNGLNHSSYYNSTYFGPTPSKVSVVDGLFISVNPLKLRERDVIFDEEFEWHHYDLSFCKRAHDKNLNIGVYPIFVIHHGLGEWNSIEWSKSNEIFQRKYIK